MYKHLFIALFASFSLSSIADEINDQNTPLHLMQPQYVTPYGIPSEADVKGTIDRVLTYLETAMPAVAVATNCHKGVSV